MPTPFTNAPDALLHLWNKFALSGDLDGSTTPATVQEAYDQVIAISVRTFSQVSRYGKHACTISRTTQ